MLVVLVDWNYYCLRKKERVKKKQKQKSGVLAWKHDLGVSFDALDAVCAADFDSFDHHHHQGAYCLCCCQQSLDVEDVGLEHDVHCCGHVVDHHWMKN